jgi:hypothetical protein
LVGATIVALAVRVPSASAASHKAFHVEKTCASNFVCTVQSSSFKAIPAGTDITCTYNGAGTGRLTQFDLAVDATFDGSTWSWDGTYWSGGGA